MSLEVLARPAPFVYGGSFSDYVKEKKKFTRFSTLARFSNIVASTSGEALACNSEEQFHPEQTIQQLYAEAREKDIGTVDTIELPECTMKTVNLVDIARYIQQAQGEHNAHDADEEEEEWENEEEEEWANEEEEELENEEHEDVEEVVINKVQSPPTDAAPSMDGTSDFLIETDSTMNDKRRMIVDSHLPIGCNSLQLIALATPPSSTSEFSMYMAFPDAMVKGALASTMAGAKAAVKKAVAALEDPELSEYSSEGEEEHEEEEEASVPKVADAVPQESNLRKSVHRFNFAADELETIAFKKAHVSYGFKDDGSSWRVDDFHGGALVPNLHKIRRNQGSASSWGGGGALLEPIVQNKASLDRPVKVTLPKLPVTPRSADRCDHVGDVQNVRLAPWSGAGPIF
mmetsp:Transcript_136148/g.236655  ORF Transcript_136148/g.236655 Transcript_136148/m.236655 type:complete len:402 (-) Transcript_136148:75-1280(-)